MSTGLQVYRGLLKAINLAFQGDLRTLTAAKTAARDQFIEHRSSSSTSQQLEDALAHARSVTKILRENIVQGTKTEKDTYKLNIHEHTERGDNATVKKLDSKVRSFKDMKAPAG